MGEKSQLTVLITCSCRPVQTGSISRRIIHARGRHQPFSLDQELLSSLPANEQLRTQEQKLDLEHQLYVHTVREIQPHVRSQDQRLSWTIMATVFAMLPGSVAGGILVRDVQKNARILGGISIEVKKPGSLMAQSRPMGDPAGADESASLPVLSHAEQRDALEDQRVVVGVPLSGP